MGFEHRLTMHQPSTYTDCAGSLRSLSSQPLFIVVWLYFWGGFFFFFGGVFLLLFLFVCLFCFCFWLFCLFCLFLFSVKKANITTDKVIIVVFLKK